MFCKYCGNKLPEKANFCPECGRINDEPNVKEEKAQPETATFFSNQSDYYAQPEPEPVNDIFEAEKESLGGSILTFGILGLAFGASGCLAILGLIFSIISRVKLKTYLAKFHETEGRATVGKILGLIGLIVSIFFMVYITFFFFLGIMMGLGGM